MATLPLRSEVDPAHTWDLKQLFETEADWHRSLEEIGARLPELESYRGTIGESAERLHQYLEHQLSIRLAVQRLHHYARRLSDQDNSDEHAQGLKQQAESLADRLEQTTAFFRPELNNLASETIDAMLQDPVLAEWRFFLEKIVRERPYTLSDAEERILAMAGDIARGPYQVFNQLNAVDLTFDPIKDEDGETLNVTPSQALYIRCMTSPVRRVRRDFFHSYYSAYESHHHTLAAALGAGVKTSVFFARARGFDSVRQAELYPNNIPEAVYDNLVGAVNDNVEALHDYYHLLRDVLEVDELHAYDGMAPLVPDVDLGRSYEDAVELLHQSLAPLGEEYQQTLTDGLLGGWVDRYENKGKHTGAYSAGMWGTHPYILMNYREDIDSIYTLAHEAGHAMHTWYSVENQPAQVSRYTIFAAEVASTFNEALLTHHLLQITDDDRTRAYILAQQVDSIRALIYRQTMFAEFELAMHTRVENDEPLTAGEMRSTYKSLLDTYFGPDVVVDELLANECLRIPHFYFGYYVYQYATGVAAALALSQRVLAGDDGALEDYLGFLSAGGSKWPIQALAEAGVDMTRPEPVNDALGLFAERLAELRGLLRS